ncbi:hypothetical protein [Fonticella tunisiensis]|uniref:Uncharacterized protein n=1 Tax=Fonticella tunisiensis TaxID=1096341 RepID=A0A4V3ESD4_9CLOT|nr:hypothetical protein [Fonticella tunisiensis]TDT50757.1 hypothetical protein EDD71_12548 [Fonticella tunisiensis]
MINNKKENILITVTLNKPITIDEFEKLIDRYKIYIHRFALRAIDENGNRVTISGTIDKNGKISRNNIKIMVSETKSELKGVIDFYGEISYKYLKELQTDERIFLVDTSADNTFIENKYKKHIPSLYWYLEEYNK